MRTLVLLQLLVGIASAQSAAQIEFFEKRVRPILANYCAVCHNTAGPKAGLDFSTTAGIGYAVQYGGEAGKLISLDKPEESLLLHAIDYSGRVKMPPTGKLKEEQLEDMRTWVHAGAPVPAPTESEKARTASGSAPAASVTAAGPRKHREFTNAEKSFWAFQKLPASVPVPAVKETSWVKTPIDRFILAKLEAQKLKPNLPADKTALLRRVTFDLTGLPPTDAEIQAFLADKSVEAYETVVERLLASPRYGEQWGRHWLDVARYADSNGYEKDKPRSIWPYRDWVINAFNKDLPYDEFVIEQLAGDLLTHPTLDQNVATGFLR